VKLPSALTSFRIAPAPLAALALSVALSACDQPPAAESLKVWTKEDHHSTDDDRPPPLAGASAAPNRTAESGGNDAQLVDITWRQQCVGCHGALGRGDGPMGPMLHAPDLGRADWQARVPDAEIAATIRNGRNRMPRFDLPEPVLRGLVARIRSLRNP
jgi:mono/diheme cytochrome c family protein